MTQRELDRRVARATGESLPIFAAAASASPTRWTCNFDPEPSDAPPSGSTGTRSTAWTRFVPCATAGSRAPSKPRDRTSLTSSPVTNNFTEGAIPTCP